MSTNKQLDQHWRVFGTHRWIVERTFGWHMFHRRLVRDFENRPDSSSSMIRIAMIDNMLRLITHQNTPSWHDPLKLDLAA
jgi:transposase